MHTPRLTALCPKQSNTPSHVLRRHGSGELRGRLAVKHGDAGGERRAVGPKFFKQSCSL